MTDGNGEVMLVTSAPARIKGFQLSYSRGFRRASECGSVGPATGQAESTNTKSVSAKSTSTEPVIDPHTILPSPPPGPQPRHQPWPSLAPVPASVIA